MIPVWLTFLGSTVVLGNGLLILRERGEVEHYALSVPGLRDSDGPAERIAARRRRLGCVLTLAGGAGLVIGVVQMVNS